MEISELRKQFNELIKERQKYEQEIIKIQESEVNYTLERRFY